MKILRQMQKWGAARNPSTWHASVVGFVCHWIFYEAKSFNPYDLLLLAKTLEMGCIDGVFSVNLWDPTLIGESNEYQQGRWTLKVGGLWDLTSVGERTNQKGVETSP